MTASLLDFSLMRTISQKATGSIERDENYVPYTRSEVNLPPAASAKKTDYAEIFEETPLWTLMRVLIMQGFGWWLYLWYAHQFCSARIAG